MSLPSARVSGQCVLSRRFQRDMGFRLVAPVLARQSVRKWPQRGAHFAASLRSASSAAPGTEASKVADVKAADGQVPAAAPEAAKAKKDQEEKDVPMGWGRFFLYGGAGVSSIIFLYYFHQAKYSLHQTEILLLDRFRRLPLYYPPDATQAVKNTELKGEGLSPDVIAALSEWFVVTDLKEAGGILRDDVLELFKELGFSEDHQAAKDFLMRGEGQLEEHRRLSGVGLQESITLLARISKPKEGGLPQVGEEAVEIMRKKIRRASPVFESASALRQALQSAPITSASSNSARSAPASSTISAPTRPSLAATMPSAPASEDEDDDNIDEAEYNRMEAARLQRMEDGLLQRLERFGSLSPAEDARLQEVRERLLALKSL